MNSVELIPVESLMPDMILGEDIYGRYDLLNLNAGDKLTESVIKVLRQQHLDYIYIEVAKGDGTFNDIKASLQQELDLMVEESAMISANMAEILRVDHGGFIDQLKDRVDLLMEMKRLHVKSTYTSRHSLNVALLSGLIAHWMELPPEVVRKVTLAGLLHDVGKVYMPLHILNKPGQLSAEEFEVAKQHTLDASRVLKKLQPISEEVHRAIMEHHERLDGSGYPVGKVDANIHLYAKIIAIADIFDAATSQKVYKSKIQPLQAINELKVAASKCQIDTYLLKFFLKNVYRLLVGCKAVLNDGRQGEIMFFHQMAPERPILKVQGKLINLSLFPDLQIVDIY